MVKSRQKKLEQKTKKKKLRDTRKKNQGRNKSINDKWSFLIEPNHPIPDPETIQQFPKMGPEFERGLSRDQNLNDNVARIFKDIRKDSLRRGFPKTDYKADTFLQIYGVPGTNKKMQRFQSHAQNSLEFLHQNLEGIILPEEIVIAKQGRDYDNVDGKIFLANMFYNKWRIQVFHEGDSRVDYQSVIIEEGGGGEYEPLLNAIFLSCCPESIISPISESLHFSTNQKKGELESSGVSNFLASQLDEAFVEAASYYLNISMLEELNRPEMIKKVESVHKKLKEREEYLYIPTAKQWIESQGIKGVQRAYDLYMEDPAKFGKAIGMPEFQ